MFSNSGLSMFYQSTWSEISNDVLLLFDETRSSYRLWTFGYYHYTILSCCDFTYFLGLDDHLPADHLDCVMGSLRPSALHWAAMIALPDICTALINRGADVSAPSVVGSPIECAILHNNAIYENKQLPSERKLVDHRHWRWDSRKKVSKHLIMAGADLDNIDVIGLLYRHSTTFTFYYDESDTDFFRVIFDNNPTFSVESLFAFLLYTLRERDMNDEYSELRYNNASLPVELLAWEARTNFAHFAPDILPLFLGIIHDDLAILDYTPSSLEFFLDINFLGISRNDRMNTTPISQEHTEHWMTKLSALIVNPSNYLEKIVSEAFHSAEFVTYKAVFGFIFRLWDNNILLDFNWRNKVGNTILHEFLEKVDLEDGWESAHTFILTAVLECQANLTISNNLNITPIELLMSRTNSNSDEMLSFVKVWRAGDISGACEKNPGLLERLLDAANSVDKVEYIFGQLAKDLDRHMQLLHSLLPRFCKADYMKVAFSLSLKHKAQGNKVSAPDEEGSHEVCSDDRSSVVGEHKAYTSTDEEENGDNGSSMDVLTRRGKYSITKDIHSSFSFVEKDQDNGLPAIESFEYACSVVKTENVPINKTLAESGGSLAVDEKTHSYLHLLSGSHDSADFWELRLLLAHDPDLEIRNHQDLTPLAIAIRSKNLRAMYALLISGANIGAHLSHRQTYLHLACCPGNEEAVWALLSAGADLPHKDDNGYTAEDLAVIIGRSDIVDLFPGRGDNGSWAGSHYSEYSTDEYLDGKLSNSEESDISDSGQLPPLSTPQDLAFRPKSSQSTSTLGE
ncbi:hypothetical protein BCON_0259g00140 [Botryotinia convoluta]|uniref:Uncharacterized protein n=1 Tax=Botryotinia convoluta TaxID=54673 RepID=A0A4Z1HGH1_9HELO|nr:hypothetical protein BCON_0259g00140 [Botryotinia convoluta]